MWSLEDVITVAVLSGVFGLMAGVLVGMHIPRPQPRKPEPKMQTLHIVEPSGGESVKRVAREDDTE